MNPTFFTRHTPRFKLPHDLIGVRWILVAHLAVTRAFELIREEQWLLTSRLENDVTIKLEDVLNNQVRNRGEVHGFDSGFFGKVRRVEIVNYDGTKKAKKPDLCFDLQREDRTDLDQLQDALFAECKPVDNKHRLSAHYCAVEKDCTGIERYIIGDYAWAMEEGLMIGYVRDGYQIHPHLADALTEELKKIRLGSPTPLQAIEVTDAKGENTIVYHTTHERTFAWRDNRHATPITLYHSWHDCG